MALVERGRATPGGIDPNTGDPLPDTVTYSTITGGFVAPRTSESVDPAGRSGVVVGLTLFAPYGTDLDGDTDHIRVSAYGANDGTYQIEGEAGDWLQPHTGWEAGLSVALVRAEG